MSNWRREGNLLLWLPSLLPEYLQIINTGAWEFSLQTDTLCFL